MTKKLAESAEAAKRAKEATGKAKTATAASKEAAAKAKATAEAAKKAAEAAWFAEQENKKALDELRAQEQAFESKKAELTKIKGDESIGVVKRNKASNELDQMMAEDPLPLRKAKINQQATVKKSEKARIAAEESVKQAEAKLAEAMTFLDRAKASGGVAKGFVDVFLLSFLFLHSHNNNKQKKPHRDVWWMQREITEKKKYLPASKQK